MNTEDISYYLIAAIILAFSNPSMREYKLTPSISSISFSSRNIKKYIMKEDKLTKIEMSWSGGFVFLPALGLIKVGVVLNALLFVKETGFASSLFPSLSILVLVPVAFWCKLLLTEYLAHNREYSCPVEY